MALSDEDIKLLEARVAELERELDKKREEETAAKVRSEAAQQVASETFEAWLALGNEAGAIFDALFQVQNLLFDEQTKKIIDRSRQGAVSQQALSSRSDNDNDWS
jgi:hypothetical protein